MTTPLIQLGNLNRLRANVIVTNNPALNVLNYNLAEGGITATFEGEMAKIIPAMTSTVNSPSPYQIVNLTLHINRAQALSTIWSQQYRSDTRIGQVILTFDSATVPEKVLHNCVITNLGSISMDGGNVSFDVTIRGYDVINESLWNV